MSIPRPDFKAALGGARLARPGAAPGKGLSPRAALALRAGRRHAARVEAAGLALDQGFPEQEGDQLHLLLLGHFDPAALIVAALDRLAVPCDLLQLSSLSLSGERNLAALTGLLDGGKVRRLDLLLSHFFAHHNREAMTAVHAEFEKRGQRVAAARVHAKLGLFWMADGRKFVLHGSANLRACKAAEQVCLARDAALFDFFSEWLTREVQAHVWNPDDAADA